MTMYKFYAVITPEEDTFTVSFPDLENVFTFGESLSHAVLMAEDVLGLMLTDYEDEGNVPASTPADKLKASLPEGASLVLIEANTDDYRE